MPKGRKLTDDVSIEELLRMREEEGLSNYEIAQRVGVNYSTIHGLIGKQPRGIRTPAGVREALASRADGGRRHLQKKRLFRLRL